MDATGWGLHGLVPGLPFTLAGIKQPIQFQSQHTAVNDNDDNENILFYHNIQIYITDLQ